MDIAVKTDIIRIANCIIPRPSDRSVILSVKTMAFNDYSLPGKTLKGESDIEGFLVESVFEKTNIEIEGFEEKILEIAYEKRGQLFERTILIVKDCKGVPTTMGDREKYGIGVFRPDINFLPQWQDKGSYVLAPGMYKTLLTYYADIPDINEMYPNYEPLCRELIDDLCRRFEKV